MEVPKRLVLDTTVLVNHLRSKGKPSTVTMLQDVTELATTQVNLFELYLGAYKRRQVEASLTSVKGLLSTIMILPFTEGVAETAGKILAQLERSGKKIEIRDLFIGTIALEQGFAVLTDNKEHFKRIPGLQTVSEDQVLVNLRSLGAPLKADDSRIMRGGGRGNSSEERIEEARR